MMRIEEPAGGCVMCGTPDADMPVGQAWMCRADAERLAWHWQEIAAVAALCGLTATKLGRVLTR